MSTLGSSGFRDEKLRALATLVLELLLPVLAFFGALYAMRFALRTEHPVLIVAIDMPVWYETSMYPVLTAGDVVFMEGVPPEEINVGERV